MKNNKWIINAFLMTFFIALIFSASSNIIINKLSNIFLIIFLFVFIIIGTAVLTANESSFHAKSSKKIKGSKEGVYLIKNASTFANICNDVIGDICGIVSGSLGALIAIYITNITNIDIIYTSLLISSLISSVTVGGKAIGKKYATKNSDEIIFLVAKFIYFFKKK